MRFAGVVPPDADLGAGGILTAVVPRDELPYVRIAFAERPLD